MILTIIVVFAMIVIIFVGLELERWPAPGQFMLGPKSPSGGFIIVNMMMIINLIKMITFFINTGDSG